MQMCVSVSICVSYITASRKNCKILEAFVAIRVHSRASRLLIFVEVATWTRNKMTAGSSKTSEIY
jgi:hypothetical protein